MSPEHYWPGLGLIVGFFLLLLVGSLVNAYAGKILLKYWDDFLGRIPFVKTLYGGFRDVVSLLPSGSGEKRDLQRVVLARFADVHAIGFVTREDVPAVLDAHGGRDWVTVYFPMSYAFGGYTIYLPRERMQPLDISVEDAMRLAITAGLTAARRTRRRTSGSPPSMRRSWSSDACWPSRLARRPPRSCLRSSPTPAPAADKYQAWRAAAAQIFAARGDANSLAAAAALRSPGRPRAQGDSAADEVGSRGTGRQGERARSRQPEYRLAALAALRQHAGLRHPRCGDDDALGGCG